MTLYVRAWHGPDKPTGTFSKTVIFFLKGKLVALWNSLIFFIWQRKYNDISGWGVIWTSLFSFFTYVLHKTTGINSIFDNIILRSFQININNVACADPGGGGVRPWFSAWCHPFMWRRRRRNGAVLRMRPGKPRPRVTADLCGKIKSPSCSKALHLSILGHKKNYRGSLIYRVIFLQPTQREITPRP
jgi:hypothetical protein